MADLPMPWRILQAVQSRLQEIRVDAGYHTDAGLHVQLESSEIALTTPMITIYSASLVGGDPAVRNQREFTLLVEAAVPTGLADAHQQVVAITEDVETALDLWLPIPGALPLRFQEAVILDAPDGVPGMVAQLLFVTGYRR